MQWSGDMKQLKSEILLKNNTEVQYLTELYFYIQSLISLE